MIIIVSNKIFKKLPNLFKIELVIVKQNEKKYSNVISHKMGLAFFVKKVKSALNDKNNLKTKIKKKEN